MRKKAILRRFAFEKGRYRITLERSGEDGSESLQLDEEIKVKGKPMHHFMRSDGILDKLEPIVFACRSDDGSVEISMQYEGLPLKLLQGFLTAVDLQWSK